MKKNHNENPWTIEELAARANKELALSSYNTDDSRISSEVTVRNLRRLVSIGAVSAPVRIGREAFYGESHLYEILKARDLMNKGFTSSSIQALREASDDNDKEEGKFFALNVSQPGELKGITSVSSQVETRVNAQSTQDALNFLDEISETKSLPKDIYQRSSNGFKGVGLNATSQDNGMIALTPEMLGNSYPRPFDLNKTYKNAHSSSWVKTKEQNEWAQRITSSIDVEVFKGVRISIDPRFAQGEISEQQKKDLIDALAAAWLKAQSK